MTAEGRFLIRTWRDRTKRHELNHDGRERLIVPLAEHLPPINERGAALHAAIEAKRERRRYAEHWVEQLEALAA